MTTRISSRAPLLLALSTLVLLFWGAACPAQEPPVATAAARFDEINIQAGELGYDQAADTVTALGGVTIIYEATRTFELRTPAVQFERTRGLLSASQGVTLIYDPATPAIITADSLVYDKQADTLTLGGAVTASQDQWRIDASTMTVNRAANTFSASGAVSILHGEDTIGGQNLSYDRNTGAGVMYQAFGCYRGVNISGERVTFASGSATFHNAVASTCGLGSMDYHIKARSITITTNNKAHFKHIELFIKSRRILRWKSYVFSFGGGTLKTEPSRASGALRVEPPNLGYNDVGGAYARSGLIYDTAGKTDMRLITDYYLLEGFFPQFEARRGIGGARAYFKAGKEFKENTGYFRYLSPVPVWNMPNAGIDFGTRLIPGTRVEYNVSAEAGRLKERHMRDPKNRAFGKLYLRYPINPRQRVVFSLIGDARYGIYTGSRKYHVTGAGIGMRYIHGSNAKHTLGIDYLHFDHEGRTFFVSDVVDTNDRLYMAASMKITQKSRVRIDAEFDITDNRFDEVEYFLARTYECVRLDLGFRKEFQSVLFRVNILGLLDNPPQAAPIQPGQPAKTLDPEPQK